MIRQPYDLYRAGVIDEYFMGMANQVAQAMDDSVTQEVTNHLFRKPNQPFGVDLAAFNMQRGREFGLPSYMEFRLVVFQNLLSKFFQQCQVYDVKHPVFDTLKKILRTP